VVVLLRELSAAEFLEFYVPPLCEVADPEPVVDLWSYVEQAMRSHFPDACSCCWEVATVQETEDGRWQHHLIYAPADQAYLVVVIDKFRKVIVGHIPHEPLPDLGSSIA